MTRQRVLSEAARLIQRNGFGDTSVNEVLAAAGITKGSLYFHFPAKDDLGWAVLEQARAEFLEFLRRSLAGSTPWAKLTGFFAAALAAHRTAGFVGGCLWGNTALEMSDKNPRYATEVAAVFRQWTALLEEVIRDGQLSGEIRTDLTAHDLALFVVSSIEGGIMLSRLTKSDGPLRTCIDTLVTFFKVTDSQ